MSHLPKGRIRRLGKLAWLTARTGSDLAISAARRMAGGEAGLPPELRAASERLVATLGEMKGAALKLGQALAMNLDDLPPEVRATVEKLLSQAPSRMPRDQVEQVVRAELGAGVAEVFAQFSEEPVAAASLGQVHAARAPDGRLLAVKVQYPGVDRALESDLKNLGTLISALGLASSLLDGRAYYDELRRELLCELDYRLEADRRDDWARAAAPFPGLLVPAVDRSRSARRVLTLDWMEGVPLHQLARSGAPPPVRFQAGAALCRAIWGPFFAAGLIHADPHPGNFLWTGDRLAVLDFGAVKRLSSPFAAAYRTLYRAALAKGTPPPLLPILEGAGFTVKGDRGRAEELVRGIDAIVRRPFVAARYDFGACTMVPQIRALLLREAFLAAKVRPPPEAVLFYRAVGGLAQVLRLLRAEGPFAEVMREVELRAATG